MKKILVTGGAGYIGSHTAIELLRADYTPVIVDNFVNSSLKSVERIKNITGKDVAFYEGDVADKGFLSDVFAKEGNIDGVIHFAAHKAVGESVREPLKYYHNNLGGLISVLANMQQHGVVPIVFSSSATVYGDPEQNPIPETAQIKDASSPYGTTKIMGEQIIRDATRSGTKISAIALRYFNPIGAHESGKIGELPLGVPSNLVPYLTQVAIGEREKLTIFGNDYNTPDGTAVRDYLHVMDLANAHIAALTHLKEQQVPFYDVFNVGTGKGVSVRELVDTFERVTGVKLRYEIGPRREGDIAVCYADSSKIERILGWKAQHSIEDALRDSWRWQQHVSSTA